MSVDMFTDISTASSFFATDELNPPLGFVHTYQIIQHNHKSPPAVPSHPHRPAGPSPDPPPRGGIPALLRVPRTPPGGGRGVRWRPARARALRARRSTCESLQPSVDFRPTTKDLGSSVVCLPPPSAGARALPSRRWGRTLHVIVSQLVLFLANFFCPW